MERVRPQEIDVVVATRPGDDEVPVTSVLERAGFRCHTVSADLSGLSRMSDIRPKAIVVMSLEDSTRDWVLNFVDGNPEAPAVVAVGGASLLGDAPEWLYDVVGPDELGDALDHRLKQAVSFQDMRRLAAASAEELGRSGAHIRMVSMIDVVTGLFNRRYFKKHLRESYAGARRYQRPLTCLLVRIEGLSALVDELGQERTNDILDSVALAITTVIRESDIAARIDDDLFGFLLPETTAEGANGLLQRLLTRLKTAQYPHGDDIRVTYSHAELLDSHPDGQALLDAALAALPV